MIVVNLTAMSITSAFIRSSVITQYMYEIAGRVSIAAISCDLCAIGIALFGFVGTYLRNKQIVKLFFIAVILILVFNGVILALYIQLYQPNQILVFQDDFVDGWIEIMRRVVDEEDTNNVLTNFINDVNKKGECCGFDSLDSPLQNPSIIDCPTSYTETCQAYINEHIMAKMISYTTMYAIVTTLNLILALIPAIFLLRIVPEPKRKANNSPGDYYYSYNPNRQKQ